MIQWPISLVCMPHADIFHPNDTINVKVHSSHLGFHKAMERALTCISLAFLGQIFLHEQTIELTSTWGHSANPNPFWMRWLRMQLQGRITLWGALHNFTSSKHHRKYRCHNWYCDWISCNFVQLHILPRAAACSFLHLSEVTTLMNPSDSELVSSVQLQ